MYPKPFVLVMRSEQRPLRAMVVSTATFRRHHGKTPQCVGVVSSSSKEALAKALPRQAEFFQHGVRTGAVDRREQLSSSQGRRAGSWPWSCERPVVTAKDGQNGFAGWCADIGQGLDRHGVNSLSRMINQLPDAGDGQRRGLRNASQGVARRDLMLTLPAKNGITSNTADVQRNLPQGDRQW